MERGTGSKICEKCSLFTAAVFNEDEIEISRTGVDDGGESCAKAWNMCSYVHKTLHASNRLKQVECAPQKSPYERLRSIHMRVFEMV